MANEKNTKSKAVKAPKNGAEDPQVGAALRSVYQRAVEEDVPDEMLDLLSKLD